MPSSSRQVINEQAKLRTDVYTLASGRAGPDSDSQLQVARGTALVSGILDDALMASTGRAAQREANAGNGWLLKATSPSVYNSAKPIVAPPQTDTTVIIPRELQYLREARKRLEVYNAAAESLKVMQGILKSYDPSMIMEMSSRLILHSDSANAEDAFKVKKLRAQAKQAKQRNKNAAKAPHHRPGASLLSAPDVHNGEGPHSRSSSVLDTSRSFLSADDGASEDVLTPLSDGTGQHDDGGSSTDADDEVTKTSRWERKDSVGGGKRGASSSSINPEVIAAERRVTAARGGSSTDADDEVTKTSRWERKDSVGGGKRGASSSSMNPEVIAAERRLIEANLEAKAEELVAIEKLLEEFRQDQESRVHELDLVQHERSNELQRLGEHIGELEHRRDAEAQIYDMEMRMKLADMPLVLQRPPKETCDACVGVSEDTLIATKAVAYLARPGAARLAVAPTGAGVTEPPAPNTRLPAELVQPFVIFPSGGRTSPGGSMSPQLRSQKSHGSLKYNASHLRTGAKAAATTALQEEYLFVLRGRFGAPDLLDRLWARDPIAYAAATTQCLQSLAAARCFTFYKQSLQSAEGFVVVTPNGADAVEMFQDLDRLLTAHHWEGIVRSFEDMSVVQNDNAAADEAAAPITSLIRKSNPAKAKEKALLFSGPRLAAVLWVSRVTAHSTKTRLRCDYNPSTLRHEFIGQDIRLLDQMLALAKGGQLLMNRNVWRCVLFCGPRRFPGHILTEFALQVGAVKSESEVALTTTLAEARLLYSTATHDVVPLDAVQHGVGGYYVKVLQVIPFELRQRLDLAANSVTSTSRRCIAERQFVQPSTVTTTSPAKPILSLALSPALTYSPSTNPLSLMTPPPAGFLQRTGSSAELSHSSSSGVFNGGGPNAFSMDINHNNGEATVTVLGDDTDDTWVDTARRAVMGRGGNSSHQLTTTTSSSPPPMMVTSAQGASVTETLKDMFPFFIPEVMLVRGFQKSIDSSHIGIVALTIPHLDALLHQPKGVACLQQYYQLLWACARKVVASSLDAHTPRRGSIAGTLGPGRVFVNHQLHPDIMHHGAFRDSVTTDPNEAKAMLAEMSADEILWFFRDPMHAVAFGLLVQQELVHNTGWPEDMSEFYTTVVPRWAERRIGGLPLTPPADTMTTKPAPRGAARPKQTGSELGLKAVIGVSSGMPIFETHTQTGLGHFTSPAIDYARALIHNGRPGEVLISPAQRDRILGPTGSVKPLPVLDTLYHVVSLAPFSTPDALKVHAVISSELRDRQAHLGDLPPAALSTLNDAHATMRRAMEASMGRRQSQFAHTSFTPSSPLARSGSMSGSASPDIAPAPELAAMIRAMFRSKPSAAPADPQHDQNVDLVVNYMASKNGGLPPRVASALRSLLAITHTKMREDRKVALVASSSGAPQDPNGIVAPTDATALEKVPDAAVQPAAMSVTQKVDNSSEDASPASPPPPTQRSTPPPTAATTNAVVSLPPLHVPRSVVASPVFGRADMSPTSIDASPIASGVQLPPIHAARHQPGDLLTVASMASITSVASLDHGVGVSPVSSVSPSNTAVSSSRASSVVKKGSTVPISKKKNSSSSASKPATAVSSNVSQVIGGAKTKKRKQHHEVPSTGVVDACSDSHDDSVTRSDQEGQTVVVSPQETPQATPLSNDASLGLLKPSESILTSTSSAIVEPPAAEVEEVYDGEDVPTVPLALFAELSSNLANLKKEREEMRRELSELRQQLKAAGSNQKRQVAAPPIGTPPATFFAAPSVDTATSPLLMRDVTPPQVAPPIECACAETQTSPIARSAASRGGGGGFPAGTHGNLAVSVGDDDHQSSLLLPQVSIELPFPVSSKPPSDTQSNSNAQQGRRSQNNKQQNRGNVATASEEPLTMSSSATSYGTDPPLFTPQLTPRTEFSSENSAYGYSLFNQSHTSTGGAGGAGEKRLRQSLVADVMDLVQADSMDDFQRDEPAALVKFPPSPQARVSGSVSPSTTTTSASHGSTTVAHGDTSTSATGDANHEDNHSYHSARRHQQQQQQSMNSTQLSSNLRDMIAANTTVAPWEVSDTSLGHNNIGLPLISTDADYDAFDNDGPLSPSLPKAPKPSGSTLPPQTKKLVTPASRSPQAPQSLKPKTTAPPSIAGTPALGKFTPPTTFLNNNMDAQPPPAAAPSKAHLAPQRPGGNTTIGGQPTMSSRTPTDKGLPSQSAPPVISTAEPRQRQSVIAPQAPRNTSSTVADPRAQTNNNILSQNSPSRQHQQQIIVNPSANTGRVSPTTTTNSFTNYCEEELFAPMHRGDVDVPHRPLATVSTRPQQVSPPSLPLPAPGPGRRGPPLGSTSTLPLLPEAPQPGSEAHAMWLAALNDQIKGRVESVRRGIR
ncbi:Hypothetical protein, putative [Bodo saltans]|uniref:Uncharacterized protein n=1 Tax=Bodo saltans TaxID=75058 RepID=A0A0S4IRC1_BODSA|nr:Hypothetical protein, putative [Bodo saltans]|eukprot:CUF34340.1 Hypothetical protein, putative [Bodo saltans]